LEPPVFQEIVVAQYLPACGVFGLDNLAPGELGLEFRVDVQWVAVVVNNHDRDSGVQFPDGLIGFVPVFCRASVLDTSDNDKPQWLERKVVLVL
jgi:hypothetical protein